MITVSRIAERNDAQRPDFSGREIRCFRIPRCLEPFFDLAAPNQHLLAPGSSKLPTSEEKRRSVMNSWALSTGKYCCQPNFFPTGGKWTKTLLRKSVFFTYPTAPQSQDLPVPALEIGGSSPIPLLLQGTQSKQSQFLEMDKDMEMIMWPGKAMDCHQHGSNSFGVTLQGHRVPLSTKLVCWGTLLSLLEYILPLPCAG